MNAIEVDRILMVATADMRVVGEQLDRLRSEGYGYMFRRSGNRLLCVENGKCYKPSALAIDEMFEVMLDDWSMYYIYAVSDATGIARGVLGECVFH